jgi:uncharacterized protein YjiK
MKLVSARRAAFAAFVLGPVAAACQGGQPGAARTILGRHDLARSTAHFELPGRLDEISGLAVSPDGRLFAHDDERATIHELLVATGSVGKRFSAGDPPLRGDFEGIAIAGERFFLVTSTGLLYEMREAEDRGEAPYRTSDTGLGAHCEVEGLDYDPMADALLLACKVSHPERGVIVIHRLPLDPDRRPLAPIEVSRAAIAAHGVDADFEPSAVAVDPTGTLILVSAPIESLIEVDRSGNVLAGYRLGRSRHPQPEGLAFGPDGTLYIADERNGQDARLTSYAPATGGGPAP